MASRNVPQLTRVVLGVGGVVGAVALAVACAGKGEKPAPQSPRALSPVESMKTFRLADPNLRVELFAAEPHVVDPVELVFDENGYAYAAEMRDYPEDPPPGQAPRSRIRRLEDSDGDGRIDRSTIFADRLVQVTSMLPWKGGLLVTAAPDIIYLKDTNADGTADERRVLFTGFAIVNSESRITNLRFGIDNWIYASNNGQKGEIRNLERPDAPPVSVLGADVRFRLDRGLFEAESGPAQFGLTMDDWGQRFITQNTIHVRHVVVPRRYLMRNPLASLGEPAVDISDHGRASAQLHTTARMFQLTPPPYWRHERTAMRQQRFRDNRAERVEVAAGYFTGASGGTIYVGDSLAQEYRGNLFTGDVAGSVVHRDLLRPSGATFVASRGANEQDKEFLASTDPWFRPCNLATGPDGHLYIVDMYREHIETPESIPEHLKKAMNFYSGDTLGRLYRLVPQSRRPPAGGTPSWRPALAGPSSSLVPLLSHPNGWWRLTAQRLLIERQDRSVVPLLRELTGNASSPQARLHALYALEGLDSLDAADVGRALQDPEAGVREHAMRLAEPFPLLHSRLVALVNDGSPRVRFQLALSLGGIPGTRAFQALAALAARDGGDSWTQMAVLSSPAGSSVAMLETLLRGADWLAVARPFRAGKNLDEGAQAGAADVDRLLGRWGAIVGSRRNADEVLRWVRLVATADRLRAEGRQTAALSGLARGLTLVGGARLPASDVQASLTPLLASPSSRVQLAAIDVARHFELRALIDASMRDSADAKLPVARRTMAIKTLAGSDFGRVRPAFERILSSSSGENPPEVLEAAVITLGTFDAPAVGALLIARWPTMSPALRMRALDVMLNHRGRVATLMEGLERRSIEAAAVDLPHREKLIGNTDPAIAARARALFRPRSGGRAEIVGQYRAAMELPGDAARGRALFEQHCAMCHLPQRAQRRVGPDLSGVSSQTREQLLTSILDPSRAIDPRYTNYMVAMSDGRMYDGVIAGETAATLTLRSGAFAEDQTVMRSRITTLRAGSASLMPDGFEQALNEQAMADVIAFLQGANLRPKTK